MISIGIGALIFAIWMIILFFGKSIGLSMLLFIVPFSYFIIYILEKNNRIKNPKFKILLVPIILLSSTYLIFDNILFYGINLLVIPLLQSILVLGLLGENFEIKLSTLKKIVSSFFSPLKFIEESMIQFINKVKENLKIDIKLENNKGKITKIIKAVVVTTPVVLMIVVLLSTADEIFAQIFTSVLSKIINIVDMGINMNMRILFMKVTSIVIAFLYFIGLFYYICLEHKVREEEPILQTKTKDTSIVNMVLVSLNVIYGVFCYIQIKSLFMRNITIDYASYARRGFFQLMIVSVINLLTILVANKKKNKDTCKRNKFITCMSLIMIMYTFIIVISAWVRMYFYENAYGCTLLRLLVYCILFAEIIMFIPTIIHVLDKKINLLKSYFIIATVVYLCMNFVNFDNIIARRNVDRYIETGKIDFYYLKTRTGSGAINQVLRILETPRDKEDDTKSEVIEYLEDEYKGLDEENMDFRDFNISKMFAKKLIRNKIKNHN